MIVDEALELAEEWASEVADPLHTAPVYIDAVVATIAEVRACHETIRRMIVERETLDRELAQWRS